MDLANDFKRNVWCILGVPFDALTLEQSVEAVLGFARASSPCFLSTPNLNFLCAAQTDQAFLESVINSELSVADGFPVVAIAKLLAIPVQERVAGSDLIERLYQRTTVKPLKVFFFGGEPGAGEKACAKINQSPSGLIATGHYAPGFGSVEEMSKESIINFINQHEIDFLIVSLGAKKGQAWIELNRKRLKAPVISHLGAVINFFAGTVKRAPLLAQRLGLEWLWRIYQEPALWRRYYADGLTFIRLLTSNILPYWLWLKQHQAKTGMTPVSVRVTGNASGKKTIAISGTCCYPGLEPIRDVFARVAGEKNCDVLIDLREVDYLDSAFLGLSLLLYKHLNKAGHTLTLFNPNDTVKKIIVWQKMSCYLP
jgi:N-acetylglucosaminyldiphosphoundecaprenol N-acetyl-beta-D-mannosaminyltransferase